MLLSMAAMPPKHDAMELAWLEDLMALVETGSFSRAAVRRHITQPAFSRRVRAFEHWVGTSLFERTSRGAVLTIAGERLAAGVPALIRDIAELQREVREIGRRETSTLHFAATHALSFSFFPGWLRSVEQRGMIAPVRLVSDSMEACEALIAGGEAQFVLCHRNPVAPSLLDGYDYRSLTVGQDALVPLVAPDISGDPIWELTGAGSLPLLAYSDDSGLGRIIAASKFHERAPALSPVFYAQLAATLLGMAVSGRGIAWLPASLASQEIASGRLVRAGGTEWDIAVAVELIRPRADQNAVAERFWVNVPTT
jgi:DNA-binding transcriptional LysR family regulator